MRSALPDVQGGGRIVRGQVSTSGGVVSGTGFTVSKTGTGTYVITFSSQFKAGPIISVQAQGGGNSQWNFNCSTATAVQVTVFSFAGATATDLSFYFEAIEGVLA